MDGTIGVGLSASVDPVIGWTLRGFLAVVFVRSLVGKLAAPREFAQAVRGYALLPDRACGAAAVSLLLFELWLVPALLAPALARPAALASAALLLLYSTAIGINLIRGRRDIDCGCSGPARRQSLNGLLVQRNLAYAVLAVAASAALVHRSLVWLDLVTIAAATCVLVGLAVAIDGLAAGAPGLRRPVAPKLEVSP